MDRFLLGYGKDVEPHTNRCTIDVHRDYVRPTLTYGSCSTGGMNFFNGNKFSTEDSEQSTERVASSANTGGAMKSTPIAAMELRAGSATVAGRD